MSAMAVQKDGPERLSLGIREQLNYSFGTRAALDAPWLLCRPKLGTREKSTVGWTFSTFTNSMKPTPYNRLNKFPRSFEAFYSQFIRRMGPQMTGLDLRTLFLNSVRSYFAPITWTMDKIRRVFRSTDWRRP